MHCSPRPFLAQARIEAKRQEELRQRESELLGARKAYFEERKHVCINQLFYHGKDEKIIVRLRLRQLVQYGEFVEGSHGNC